MWSPKKAKRKKKKAARAHKKATREQKKIQSRAIREELIKNLSAPMHADNEITVYTDGAYEPTSNTGGWAAVILDSGQIRELGGKESPSTVNRMELRGPLEALRTLVGRQKTIRIRSDSTYVVNTLSKWASKWEKRGWIKDDGKLAKNVDLIKVIRELEKQFPSGVIWEYTPGHAGVSGNERADEIAEGFITEFAELYDCPVADHPYDFETLMEPSPKPKYYINRKRPIKSSDRSGKPFDPVSYLLDE